MMVATTSAAMDREVYDQEHEAVRESFRSFLNRAVIPKHAEWEEAGSVPRRLWNEAGENGYLCTVVSEAYGGPELKDFRYEAVMIEEASYAGLSGLGFFLHSAIVAPYLLSYGTEEQKLRWLPKMVTGEAVTAIAMTEPNTGSDLAGIQTSARREGDSYLLNGQKTFITNGLLSDLVIVAARTDPAGGHHGLSLFVVDTSSPGLERRALKKIGMHAQDTAEIFLSDVRVPATDLLGDEGSGFYYLVSNLPQERMIIALGAVAGMRACLDLTRDYCSARTAFGRPIGAFQNSRFRLAEMKTIIEIATAFVDKCLLRLVNGTLSPEEAAIAKWWTTEMQKWIVDTCFQLHGGIAYMAETPISRYFLDTRPSTIYGGSTEIMKEIIGRSMGL